MPEDAQNKPKHEAPVSERTPARIRGFRLKSVFLKEENERSP